MTYSMSLLNLFSVYQNILLYFTFSFIFVYIDVVVLFSISIIGYYFSWVVQKSEGKIFFWLSGLGNSRNLRNKLKKFFSCGRENFFSSICLEKPLRILEIPSEHLLLSDIVGHLFCRETDVQLCDSNVTTTHERHELGLTRCLNWTDILLCLGVMMLIVLIVARQACPTAGKRKMSACNH